MSSRVWEFVEEGYKAVKACLLAYAEFTAEARNVAGWAQSRDPKARVIPKKLRTEFATSLEALKRAVAEAGNVVQMLKPFVDALEQAIVRFGGECSPSLAESIVKLAARTAERIGDAKELDFKDPELVAWLFRLQQVREPRRKRPETMFLDVPREIAELDREAAKLALLIRQENRSIDGYRFGLWRVVDGLVELQDTLRELHGYSERMLCQLILADARTVTYQVTN